MEQIERVDFRASGYCLSQVGQADQQQQDERDCREQRIERQGTSEKRDVVFVSGLQGAAEKAGG